MNATEHPVDFVRSLSEKRKEEVFFALLQDIYAGNAGASRIPLRQGETDLGYLVRPQQSDAAYRELLRTLPERVVEELSRPDPDGFRLDDVLTPEEVRAIEAATAASTS